MRDHLDDFIFDSEQEIMRAMVYMIRLAYTLAEGTGASLPVVAYKIRERLADKMVGFLCSSGNISLDKLRKALDYSVNELNE